MSVATSLAEVFSTGGTLLYWDSPSADRAARERSFVPTSSPSSLSTAWMPRSPGKQEGNGFSVSEEAGVRGAESTLRGGMCHGLPVKLPDKDVGSALHSHTDRTKVSAMRSPMRSRTQPCQSRARHEGQQS